MWDVKISTASVVFVHFFSGFRKDDLQIKNHGNERTQDRILSRFLVGVGPTMAGLRDRSNPGLPSLKRKHRQVVVGTGLLQTAIELMMVCIKSGGCGSLEHPRPRHGSITRPVHPFGDWICFVPRLDAIPIRLEAIISR